MRQVDCEYLISGTRNCNHPDIKKGYPGLLSLIGLEWNSECVEHKLEHVDCHYRESIWDMLKKEDLKYQSVTNRPAPPAPPPTRVYVDWKLVGPLTDVKWKKE